MPADYFIGDDYTFYEADSIDNDFLAANPNVTLIGSSTRKFNCHGYAWHKIEGGIDVWLSGIFDTTYYGYGLVPYFSGSYPSYAEVWTPHEATKIGYEISNQQHSFDHSALPTNNPDTVISKWGNGPILRHHYTDCPYWMAGVNLRYFKLLIPKIIGGNEICAQEAYYIPSDSITSTTYLSWTVSPNLRIVSGANSHTVCIEPSSSIVSGDDEYIEAIVTTVYEDLNAGENVVVVLDTIRKDGLHVSNEPSNVQIHVPVEPIYGEVEAMVWASSYPGEESYNWQVSGGTIVSVTGSEMILIADCPSRRGITISVKAINVCGESSWVYKNVEVDCSGGINPLSILPNPADGYVDIIINQSQLMANQIGDEAKYEISVYNQSSLLIYKTKTYNSQLSINTQSFNEGIYYIILKYNGKMYNKQLIISR